MGHGIGNDGVLSPSIKEANMRIFENAYDTIFNETDSGQLVPRAVFVDLEPTVTGKYENNYHLIYCCSCSLNVITMIRISILDVSVLSVGRCCCAYGSVVRRSRADPDTLARGREKL